jgi:hypothetical protein
MNELFCFLKTHNMRYFFIFTTYSPNVLASAEPEDSVPKTH